MLNNSCMGGFCKVRETCRRYRPGAVYPVERMCAKGRNDKYEPARGATNDDGLTKERLSNGRWQHITSASMRGRMVIWLAEHPGEWLSEEDLAVEFDVDQSGVRDLMSYAAHAGDVTSETRYRSKPRANYSPGFSRAQAAEA